ncbi:MAG: cupin domain-containing protein [Rhodospirillales bacterium]|jgi:gentisate 1,2-dioxygenase|nr:hypothetical protein [Rhodospirillaceae bacterium]MDP6427321.1 cupin domain-containing protein [Rhodospirillales bacterium]MDP6645101.1 cupin domain-containing protein [Rhodospirillales bacterium]MDP6841617.1 cupin domain-containing protein [Rhodospirillales bacterium]
MTEQTDPTMTEAEAAEFHGAMEKAQVYALWEHWDGRYATEPEPPCLWPWESIQPLMQTAVGAMTMDQAAERRVLCLANRDLDENAFAISPHFAINVQILAPGEHAAPHRHSIHALRFVLAGGSTTIVDGKRCPMDPGDMILTPAWTWHEHLHDGTEPAIWVDVLDSPIHRHFDTVGWESGPTNEIPDRIPDTAFHTPGLTPAGETGNDHHSSMFHYPWVSAVEALVAVPAAVDGSRLLRYTDPVTGAAVMNRLDCYLLGLDKGVETIRRRSTANVACVVADGAGTTRVGEETVTWQKNDIFTLPHGNWISHCATSEAKLFMVSDREILRRLDLLHDEVEG